jgi:hypothetical protein
MGTPSYSEDWTRTSSCILSQLTGMAKQGQQQYLAVGCLIWKLKVFLSFFFANWLRLWISFVNTSPEPAALISFNWAPCCVRYTIARYLVASSSESSPLPSPHASPPPPSTSISNFSILYFWIEVEWSPVSSAGGGWCDFLSWAKRIPIAYPSVWGSCCFFLFDVSCPLCLVPSSLSRSLIFYCCAVYSLWYMFTNKTLVGLTLV